MSTRPPRPMVYWAVALGGAGLLGAAAGLIQPWVSPLVGGLVLAVACAVGLGVCAWKWTVLDEAAREAHKFAWFWGGSAGLCAVAGLGAWLVRSGPALSLDHRFAAFGPGGLLALGLALCVGLQLIGYLVAWVGWWLARR